MSRKLLSTQLKLKGFCLRHVSSFSKNSQYCLGVFASISNLINWNNLMGIFLIIFWMELSHGALLKAPNTWSLATHRIEKYLLPRGENTRGNTDAISASATASMKRAWHKKLNKSSTAGRLCFIAYVKNTIYTHCKPFFRIVLCLAVTALKVYDFTRSTGERVFLLLPASGCLWANYYSLTPSHNWIFFNSTAVLDNRQQEAYFCG